MCFENPSDSEYSEFKKEGRVCESFLLEDVMSRAKNLRKTSDK